MPLSTYLYISMHNSLLVRICKGAGKLQEIASCRVLLQVNVVDDLVVQVAAFYVLEKKVGTRLLDTESNRMSAWITSISEQILLSTTTYPRLQNPPKSYNVGMVKHLQNFALALHLCVIHF